MARSIHTTSWRWRFALGFYRLLGPLLLIIALPSWLKKMIARGGWHTPFGERFGIYRDDEEWDPSHARHFHAVSVGETLIALKIIRALQEQDRSRCVLAVSTATAYAIAQSSASDLLRVVYAPIDLWITVRLYLSRFQPRQIVLIEAEAWPELLQQCEARHIPVLMINARLSARSERRFRKLHAWISPMFRKLSLIAVQEQHDRDRFASLGIDLTKIHVTGSIKFDPAADRTPAHRPDFSHMLETLAAGKKIILAASTHDGEEAWIGKAILATGAFYLCVPRHAERRAEVTRDLESIGYHVTLRSQFSPTEQRDNACLVVDSTGELKDWTAHADLVIIGKSFLAEGGQNPAEAIMAQKPLIFGPHMENFEPLASTLVQQQAVSQVTDQAELTQTIVKLLAEDEHAQQQIDRATAVLHQHHGATERSIALLSE